MNFKKINENNLEYLNQCILCNSTNEAFKLYCRKSDYNILQCKNCKLIFVNPRDKESTILHQYCNDKTSPASYYLRTKEIDSLNFNKRLDWIEERIGKGKLLDIGCGVGTFMEVAKRRGWEVTGIEPNKITSRICKDKKLKTYTSVLDHKLVIRLAKKKFDLVCLNDSIEHFPNPLQSLELISNLLRKNSFLVVNTPNISSMLSKIFQIKPKEHLFYFTKNTLSKTLSKVGFEIEIIAETGGRRDISSLHFGATFENKNWLYLTRFLTNTKLDKITSIAMDKMFRDQLFALVKKV